MYHTFNLNSISTVGYFWGMLSKSDKSAQKNWSSNLLAYRPHDGTYYQATSIPGIMNQKIVAKPMAAEAAILRIAFRAPATAPEEIVPAHERQRSLWSQDEA